ncbi:hypothetical protein BLSTO_05329 [Blastocystis sp. subtype 1]
MQKKAKNQVVLRNRSSDLKKRESIINYMLELTEQFSLHLSTCFVAISFYDRVFHEFSTDVKTQGKVGIVCLLVAAKYEEKEVNTPSFSFFCNQSYSLFKTVEEISLFEINVVEASWSTLLVTHRLHWRLDTVTCSHFIDMLTSLSVLFNDDTYLNRPVSRVARKYVDDFLHFFLCLSVSIYPFSLFSPCVQTGAIVMASRRAAGIVPIWRTELEELTGCSLDNIYSCFEVLWKVFKEKYPSQKEQIKQSPTVVPAV